MISAGRRYRRLPRFRCGPTCAAAGGVSLTDAITTGEPSAPSMAAALSFESFSELLR